MKLYLAIVLTCTFYLIDLKSQADLNIFKDVTPVWIHGTFDTTALDIVPYDGFTKLEHIEDLIVDSSIYSLYNYPVSTDYTDGGYIEKLDINTGKLIWNHVYDLRTMEINEHPNALILNANNEIEILGFRGSKRVTINDTHEGRYRFCSRSYNPENGTLVRFEFPEPGDSSAPFLFVRSKLYDIDKYLYKSIYTPSVVSYFNYIFSFDLDHKGRHISADTIRFNEYEYQEANELKRVTKDSFVTVLLSCNTYNRYSDTIDYKVYIKIFDQVLNEISSFDISNDLQKNKYILIDVMFADKNYMVLRYISPGTNNWSYKYLIYDYNGNLLDSFDIDKYKMLYGTIVRISGDEFLVGGIEQINDGGANPLYFYKKKIGHDMEFLRKIDMKKLDHCLLNWHLYILHDNDILLNADYWKIAYSFSEVPFLKFPVKIWFSSKDIDFTSGSQETGWIENLTISPNPSSYKITISCERSSEGSIDIVDRFGRIVCMEKISECEEKSIDISGLNAGLYFVRVVDERGIVTGSGKFVKD